MTAACRQPVCRRSARARGFTLIELLTVIAIISLLIGIAIPALSGARRQALKTATNALLSAIGTGCEMFRNDNNEYPKSSPAWFGDGTAGAQTNWEVNGMNPLSGANLIVDAMVGRDAIGYDPKVGTGLGNTNQSRWYDNAMPPNRSRNQLYVESDKISTSNLGERRVKDAFGEFPDQDVVQPTVDGVLCPVFLDKFDFPILYYRANPNRTTSTRIMQSIAANQVNTRGDGVYDGRDNMVFTDHELNMTTTHFINEASDVIPAPPAAEPVGGYANNFSRFITSLRGSSYNNANPREITFSRPVNAEKFILLTPGADGIWGNLDDVGNFDVLSENR